MKKSIICLSMILMFLSAFAFVEETGSFKAFLYGSAPQFQYDNWVSHVSEGIALANYNLYAPYDRQTNGFGNYKTPSAAEVTAWETALDLFLTGQFETAEIILNDNAIPYQIVVFNDTDTNRQYHVLRENVNMSFYDDNGTAEITEDDEVGSFSYGWGLYVINTTSQVPVIVNMPHPNDDFITIPVGHKAFIDWNARYLIVAGAGREVKWTNATPYTNSKSLSDPSRVTVHPFNSAYRKFCDYIRANLNHRELSVQIHSYDWNRHAGYANLQISVGNQNTNPNLPTRDLSSNKLDLINASDYVVHPQNSVGVHQEVLLNDYYSVYYTTNPFTYLLNDSLITVNNDIDLPGFAQNIQQNYSVQGTSDWDVFDPFFHIEMDELPNCYPQNQNNYFWFYGYNAALGKFDYSNLFGRSTQYYSKWIDAVGSILPTVFELNDGQSPAIPQNLTVNGTGQNFVRLSWTPIDSYDFKTYEILYATSPINDSNFQVFNRSNNAQLASLLCNEINVTGLSTGQNYYFKIRAIDYNNNISNLSSEVSAYTGSALLDQVTAYGDGNKIVVKFRAVSQNNNLGFKIYRKSDDTDFSLISDYNSNPALNGSTQSNVIYTFNDTGAFLNTIYTYKITAVNNNNSMFDHYEMPSAQLQEEFSLIFSNQAQSISNTITFSKNMFASEGNDNYFDVVKSTTASSPFIWAGFYEQYWANNGVYLSREVHGDFDLTQDVKAWRILVKTDQLNTPILARVSDNFSRNSEKLYLREVSNSTYTNLAANQAQFTIANANYKEFYLYWGNLTPTVTIGSSQNTIYQAGANATFYFSKTLNFLIQNHTVYIKNATDSILVASGLSSTATSANFTIPNNRTMHNAHVYVKTICTDGEIIITESPYMIGIVPSSIAYQVPAGYSMQSNPYIAYNITNNDLGPNSQISLFENNTFSIQNSMLFNKGYALNVQNSVNTSLTQSISSYSQTQMMVPYWNLLGNPHLSSYRIKDLQFNLNNVAYSFGELVQQSLIAPVVYVCRENQYMATDTINPYESFFIYADITAENTLNCNFVPYYQNGLAIEKNDILWSSKIYAIQQDRDEVVFGVCKTKNNEVGFLSEFPEPPNKAISNNISMYIPVDENLNDFSYSKLNQYLRTEFNETEPEVKEWPLAIQVNDLSPITLTSDFVGLPTGYSIRIAMNNQEHTISPGNPTFTFTPQSTGIINANLLIGNQYVGNHDQIAKPFAVRIYPNPFNPVTNIAFDMPAPGDVEISIYNIKGQKVNNLVHEKLKSGSHSFQWNGKDSYGKNCASNIYFALVKVNGKQQVIKKITLLK